MFYHDFQVVLQEVPGEISLSFSICGCPLQCKGCHSPFLWKEGNGILMTENVFNKFLEQYKGYASCVLFMGGEWHEEKLIGLLKIAKAKNYKSCLYTGEESISSNLKQQLTFLKTGKWIAAQGGLSSKNTNQIFTNLKTNQNLNYLFQKTDTYDTTK
ncbi:anaerobic ribonucleoside-triphosphate reductase activating protein [Flavicella sediminum]|uniref:anaerobic ribonucleoside-triphosphate reductase activating protein n=1 Tax=Flavicella sediminum TaxID=2585141 RepID=UPI00112220E7|nr:anaerobic ribonucleoside-triphosphate reductase activating protein [Flavicella sediminum]